MIDLLYFIADIVAYLVLVVDLLVIYGTIFVIRRRHPGEVYAIWYACSFFFIFFFGLSLIARVNNVSIEDVCGTHKDACRAVFETFTDIGGEAAFLGTIVTLALGPQLLTYLISGLFGTASAPRFVHPIQAIAVWGVIKFLAGLGGIIMAESIVLPLAESTEEHPHFGFGVLFSSGATCVAAAFMIAAVYTIVTDAFAGLAFKQDGFPGAIRAIHKWCTRYVPETPPYTLTRTALIALLKSDAVYDFISQNEEST